MLAVNAFWFVALGSVAGNDDVTNFDSGDAFSDTFDDSCGLMSKDAWELSFWVTAIEPVDIGVAEGVGDDFDSDLSFFGRVDEDFFDDEGFFGLVGDGGFAEDGFTLEALHSERYE